MSCCCHQKRGYDQTPAGWNKGTELTTMFVLQNDQKIIKSWGSQRDSFAKPETLVLGNSLLLTAHLRGLGEDLVNTHKGTKGDEGVGGSY